MLAKPTPLGRRAKILLAIIVVELFLMWGIMIYGYQLLPNVIPTHFGFSGRPDAYGSKNTLLILPAAFSIAPAILLIITLLRFRLANKHPYLLNLPAFYTRITQLPPERRGELINRYFEAVLTFGAILTSYLLILELGIYQGTMQEKLPTWLLPTTILTPILLTLILILHLRKIGKEIESMNLNSPSNQHNISRQKQ